MPEKINKTSQPQAGFVYLLVLKLSKYFRLNFIVYFPILLSGLIFIIGSLIVLQVYPNGAPLHFTGTLFFLIALIASFSGFIQISIEEVPGFLFPIEGKAAVVFGILWIAFFWLMGISAIWYFFF